MGNGSSQLALDGRSLRKFSVLCALIGVFDLRRGIYMYIIYVCISGSNFLTTLEKPVM